MRGRFRSFPSDYVSPVFTHSDAVLNLLIAGRDTTAQNLAWVTFHLLTRPEILAKARSEIDSSPPVTYDSFKSMVYLNAIFNEVRLA